MNMKDGYRQMDMKDSQTVSHHDVKATDRWPYSRLYKTGSTNKHTSY